MGLNVQANPQWQRGRVPDFAVAQEVQLKTRLHRPSSGESASHPNQQEGKMSGVDRDQVADMIAASEARGSAQLERVLSEVRVGFAEIRGEIGSMQTKVSALPSTLTVFGAAFTAALTLAAIVLAALSFGNDMLSRGFSARDVASVAAEDALANAAKAPPLPADPKAP